MKTLFFFLACTCLIGGLTASFIGFPLEDKEINFAKSENLDNNEFISENNLEELIIPSPQRYPTRRPGSSTIKPPTTKLTTSNPSTTEPSTSEPTTSEPTTTEPTTSEPTTSEPTTSEPTTSEPTTSEPTTSEPTTSEPTTSEPATSEPTTSEPTTSEPATSETLTTEPATSKPSAPPTKPPKTTTLPPTRLPRPSPPATTPKPRPNPDFENSQIYNNAAGSLGPFAGKLINVVFNKGGNQKTVQENEISYNLRFLMPNRGLLEEENEN